MAVRRQIWVCMFALAGLLEARAEAQSAPPEPAEEPSAGQSRAGTGLSIAKELFLRSRQHLQGQSSAQLLDQALSLAGYAGLRQSLHEIADIVRDDPYLREAWQQLKLQYKPELTYSAYAGGLAESTGYAGLVAGASVDLAAPLCRYVGAELNTHGFRQSSGSGLAYDSRVTACLPWGPFSFELGYLRQRDLRVAVDALPSLPSSRFGSDGFEMRIRGFRYFADAWNVSVVPADVAFRSYQAADQTSEFSSYSVDAAFLQYTRYGRGFLQADRELRFFAVTVSGAEELDTLNLSSTVLSMAPVSLSGAHLGSGVYLSGAAQFTQGRIVSLDAVDAPLHNRFYFTTHATLEAGSPELHGSLDYQRLLVPDSEFRLVMEDRITIGARTYVGASLVEGELFGALTREQAAPETADGLGREPRFGGKLSYGRPAWGPFYARLSANAAHSYYANALGGRLLIPRFEYRALATLTAALSSD